MLRKGNMVLGVIGLLILTGGFALYQAKKQTTNSLPQQNLTVSSQAPYTASPTTSAREDQAKPASTSKTVVPISGTTRGQITCNYEVPATPNQYGSADIKSEWDNLSTGKNSSARVSVCVYVNGTSRLVSTDKSANGSRVDTASWISLNSDYIFILYDQHGGDLTDCNGTVLSSCELNTNLH